MNIFKKLILVSALLVPALVEAGGVSSTFVSERAINGSFLCVSNNTTISSVNSSNCWYYNWNIGTNVLSGTTNANGILIPSPLTILHNHPNANSDPNQSLSLQIIMGYTNYLFLSPNDTPMSQGTTWAVTNITPFFASTITNLTSTNTWTLTLTSIGSPDFMQVTPSGFGPGPLLPDTAFATRTFSITGTFTNGVPQVYSTNLPVAFGAGAYGFAVTFSNVGTNTGWTGLLLNAINLNGWVP